MSKNMTLQVEKKAAAWIDANKCVNCGTCQDYCPVSAISEKQKAICHLCPDCTEMKSLTPDQIIEMQSKACTLECPLGLSPQGFINLYKAGKYQEAFETIWNKNPLPGVTGYVCHHPCQSECKRGSLVDSPMEIRAIQRKLAEMFADYVPASYPILHQERIAVIGAGPAGLAAAHWLSQRGYKVTVYDQNSEPGGMLVRGIPDFRLSKELARKEIARLEKAGIEICCNAKINASAMDTMLKNYDKVIVAVGTQISKVLPIDGFRTQGVHLAVNLMERVNAGQKVALSGQGVVIGGGSVAIDTARAALRLGAEKVTVICLESGDAIPAHKWELDEAKEEGIDVIDGVTPLAYVGPTAKLEGVKYAKIENFDPKNFKYDVVAGSKTILPADFAIVAIGQKMDGDWKESENVCIIGDAAHGKCSVIDAMASGRKAAIAIDNALRGREYEEYEIERTVEPGDLQYKIYPAMRRKLEFPNVPKLSAAERTTSFDVVEGTFSDDDACVETYRCLQCGYNYVDPEKCIGCGVCQKVCPKGDVITLKAISE